MLADPATWPGPQVTTSTATSRYGTAVAAAWDRLHRRLTHRAAWLGHDGELPVIDGTLIRLAVDHLPGELVYAGFSLGVLPAQKLAQTRPGARGATVLCLRPGLRVRHLARGGAGAGARDGRRPDLRRRGRHRRRP